MRALLAVVVFLAACAPARERTLVIDRTATGYASTGAEDPAARWSFRAPRGGRYLVRADAWTDVSLVVRDARGAVLGSARGEWSPSLVVELRSADEIFVEVEGRASHRITVREVVPHDANVAPRTPLTQTSEALLRAIVERAEPLEPGERTVTISAGAPAFVPSCGDSLALSATARAVSLSRESALEVHASSDATVVIEVRRADESLSLIACASAVRASVRRRLPAGDYVLVVGTAAPEMGAIEVPASTTVTELGADARAP